jgi:hypothetical protein
MSSSVRCRYASLIAFCEARDRQLELSFGDGDDGCGRQEGGKFGQGNSCQAEGQGLASAIRAQAETAGVASFTGSNVPKAFGKASSVRISNPGDVLDVFSSLGSLTLDKAVGMLPGAREPGAKVVVSGSHRGDNGIIQSTVVVPLADYGDDDYPSLNVRVKTSVERFGPDSGHYGTGDIERSGVEFSSPVRSALHLDLLSASSQTQEVIVAGHRAMRTPEDRRTPEEVAAIEAGSKMERKIASKMMSMTIEAIAEAEDSGIDAVYTYAAGAGTGRTNLGDSPDSYRGYALWGRFGLDGNVAWRGRDSNFGRILDGIASDPNHPLRGAFHEDVWRKYQSDEPVTLQDVIATKEGERLWRQHGIGLKLAINLKDKKSKGYQRFQRMKKAASRAGGEGREFFWWLAEHRGDPMDYFKAERRNCGTGSGGFQKGNTCGSQLAADVAGGAITGAAVGAASALGTAGTGAAPGAAAGAAIGAVKGLYDNQMRPTRAAKAIAAIGSSDEQVAGLVKTLGGTPKSIAEATGKKSVSIAIKGSDGKTSYEVAMDAKSVRIKPSKDKGSMSKDEIAKVKSLAESVSPKSVEVSVGQFPSSTLAKFVRAGASLAVSVGGAFVASFVGTMAPAIAGTAVEASTGVDIEKIIRGRK